MYKVLKNGNSKGLEIRNSPFDRFATIVSRIIFKGNEGMSNVGVGLGYFMIAGLIKEAKGKNSIFMPFLYVVLLFFSSSSSSSFVCFLLLLSSPTAQNIYE
jgi:hypothetical protein